MFEIKFELGRGAASNPGRLERTILSTPAAIALTMAYVIRDRVERHAQPAQPFGGYSASGIRLISPRYPKTFGGSETRGGAVLFTSPQQFHALQGARPGAFSVSGGMWGGFSAVGMGPGYAADRFRGRSEGQDPNYRNARGGGRTARGIRPSNALKAKSVLKSLGINVLALTESELEQLGAGLTFGLREVIAAELVAAIKWVGAGAPSGDVARALIKRLT